MQRIYGISFPKASQLEEHLRLLEEAKQRDHKKIGKELELFMLAPEGPGFPFFLPKGMVLRMPLALRNEQAALCQRVLAQTW